MGLATVEEVVEDIRWGKFAIIVDDEGRENEGDLAIAGQWATPEAINFMATHGRGLICISLTGERLEELRLPMMVDKNTATFGTAFTVSVDIIEGATTGISAHDRAATIRAMVDPATQPEDLARPGHIFPLRYQEGGVLVRAGQTEAVVDLCNLAGLAPAGVICEIMDEDGSMARMARLEAFSERHAIRIISVAQIIAYRLAHETLIERVAEARLPTEYGEFTAVAYKSKVDADQHVALVKGDVAGEEPVLVRVHSECLTGDTFGSVRCDCGEQMRLAMKAIQDSERGVFLYMRQEGRGIGLHNKIRAYALQDNGMDTVEANESLGFAPDLRHYGVGAQILLDLGVRNLRFLTNNPRKVIGLEGYGLTMVERVPIVAKEHEENRQYMETKRVKLGHLLDVAD
jgi:3,4-dihydroxy 2-butanone 4-phosphate synthase/GTP cyclohydrolase II